MGVKDATGDPNRIDQTIKKLGPEFIHLTGEDGFAFEFNKRGGRVAYGTDDNYIWATPGFSNVRELQLLRESGMHNLEVIKSATLNSAQTLRQKKLGLVISKGS